MGPEIATDASYGEVDVNTTVELTSVVNYRKDFETNFITVNSKLLDHNAIPLLNNSHEVISIAHRLIDDQQSEFILRSQTTFCDYNQGNNCSIVLPVDDTVTLFEPDPSLDEPRDTDW